MTNNDLNRLGEERHQTCRYGFLVESWAASDEEIDLARFYDRKPKWKPSVAPCCSFSLPEPCPPMLRRIWGGGIDLVRDCAVCPAHEVLP